MKITPQLIDRWRLVPRAMIVLYGIVCWLTFNWFTDLAKPTTQHVTFAVAIWGAAAVWFGFYTRSGGEYPTDKDTTTGGKTNVHRDSRLL